MTRISDFFVLAHNIRSLHNVGSIFRIADVFAVSKIFLTGYTGHPPDSKISKVSLGAEETVPWEYSTSAARVIGKLKKQYPTLTVVGLENNLPGTGYGHKLHKLGAYKVSYPVLLVLGEEVAGIPKPLLKKCDLFLEIPQYGKKESLNVSVAFGISAYEITKKHKI